MKNRRGDIPITILVIGVFVICTLALLSFISSTIKVRNSFVGTNLIEKASVEIEKSSLDTYFNETKNKGFLPWSEEKIMFSVKYESPG